jgi:hypothetical protein
VIAGGDRSGELPPEVEPTEGAVEAEGEERAGDEVAAG